MNEFIKLARDAFEHLQGAEFPAFLTFDEAAGRYRVAEPRTPPVAIKRNTCDRVNALWNAHLKAYRAGFRKPLMLLKRTIEMPATQLRECCATQHLPPEMGIPNNPYARARSLIKALAEFDHQHEED